MPKWLSMSLIMVLTLACREAAAQSDFEGWNLEPGVSQAHLVMVARVASISRVTVVEGAKTDVALREYRFQPIRRLKGLFQRDQLSMTAADLGSTADASVGPPLKEGEYRLLILAQQQGRFLGCVSAAPGAATFDERVPLLTGPDDRLVGAIETLIQVADARSRRERANLLIGRLQEMDGVAAVPILSSLRLRSDWAASDPRALPTLTRLAHDPAPSARTASLELLRDLLATGVKQNDPQQLDSVADAFRTVLATPGSSTRVRVAAIEGLGYLTTHRQDLAWPHDFLLSQLAGAQTYAEKSAAATALARSGRPQSTAAVLDELAKLPLDEQPGREAVYAKAAVRLDGAKAELVLLTRLERSLAARQSPQAEIEALGRMGSKKCLSLLLAAAAQPDQASADRHEIAWALGRLGDDRAAAVLVGWLRGEDFQLKETALSALESLDSPAAAREARPLLKSEAHLPYKLRLARLLARHGLADGYALATEHLADASQTAEATLVLAALNDARTTKDLNAIVSARPDRHWLGAALAGLAATGDASARKQLLEILSDDRNPLIMSAAEAAGLAGEEVLVPPLVKLAQSRDKQISKASLLALRRFFGGVRTAPLGLAATELDFRDVGRPALVGSPQTRSASALGAASLVVDAHVDADLRQEAFALAKLLRGDGYDKLLADVTDQAELEGTPLLAMAQAELRRQRGVEL